MSAYGPRVNFRLFPTAAAMKTLPAFRDMSDEDIEAELAAIDSRG